MNIFLFLSLITFQVTLLSIVAIILGQNKLVEKIISGLKDILNKFLRA